MAHASVRDDWRRPASGRGSARRGSYSARPARERRGGPRPVRRSRLARSSARNARNRGRPARRRPPGPPSGRLGRPPSGGPFVDHFELLAPELHQLGRAPGDQRSAREGHRQLPIAERQSISRIAFGQQAVPAVELFEERGLAAVRDLGGLGSFLQEPGPSRQGVSASYSARGIVIDDDSGPSMVEVGSSTTSRGSGVGGICLGIAVLPGRRGPRVGLSGPDGAGPSRSGGQSRGPRTGQGS